VARSFTILHNCAGEAKRILQDYYSDDEVTIGKIVEKEYHLEAKILDSNNRVVDRGIVDRRKRRIRSIC
jgi:biotin carboxylase